jgi:ketosteroid isomerase-like protein
LRVTPDGIVDNTKFYEGSFKAGFNRLQATITDAQQISDDVITATGEAHLTGKNDKGDPLDVTAIWSDVLVKENGQWKIRQLTSMPKAPPAQQTATTK